MSENNHLTGRQIAAARALAGLGQSELAETANISVPTLRRMEASDGKASGYANNLLAIRAALEAAGVVFIDGDYAGTGGPGVRMKDTE